MRAPSSKKCRLDLVPPWADRFILGITPSITARYFSAGPSDSILRYSLDGHPALRRTASGGFRSVLAVSSFRFRARLDLSIPSAFLRPARLLTPLLGYSAPHLSARGTSTLLNNALLSAHFPFADIHVSHLSSGGTGVPGMLGRACKSMLQDVLRAQCASRHRFLRSAEPDIHLLSQTPKSRHRRLSLCSLPVPKQFVESLGRVISFAQSATCRTWQSAHFVHPVYFGSIYAAGVLRSSAGTKSLCCRSTASKYATIFRATASVARFPFPFCLSLS